MLPKLGNKIRIWLSHQKPKEVWPVITLLIISILLCILNYSPGTWLSGWDTLHPEFNFGLAFERVFYGVFRVEQGLGAVAGHSHMADLPRIIILYLSHFIIPLSFLRYFYVFLNLILGALGMYFLLKKHFLKDKHSSFLGALFYLLNVGTVQTFNVPFEMFTTLYATLPFIFYFAHSYLTENSHKTRTLFFFGLFSFLNSPSAYAATLWLVCFLGFLIYFSLFSLINRKNHENIFRRFVVLGLIMVSVSLYWLLPNVYFILYHGAEVANANINILFSDQAFLKNKEFGNLNDLLLLKSFYFDWSIYQGADAFTDLLSPYITHLKNPPILLIAYLLGVGFVAGAIYLVKSLKKQSIPIFALLIFCLVFLINNNFPISPLFNFLQHHVPFFKEAFRFPDDKIFNIYIFLVSIFFGYFALFALKRLRKINVKLDLVFTVLILVSIIFYSLPSFSGNLINKYMKVVIPQNYFALFDYLKTQPKTARVANLPINSPYGWVYYNWGFQGAGFLYFGVSQPLLDRDFDRWSPYNESYYREMSYAIYSKNDKLLKNTLTKYNIGFVFIDKSVLEPLKPQSVLYFDQTKLLLEKTGLVLDEKKIGNIELYKIKNNPAMVSSLNVKTNVNPTTNTTYEDFAYNTFGNYISTLLNLNLDIAFYPFRNLIDNQSKLQKDIVKLDNEKFTLIPMQKVNNFISSDISNSLNLIPSDLIVQRMGAKLDLSLYLNTPIFDQTPSSSPIKGSVDIGQRKENILFSINQQQLFNLNNLPENTPISLGKTTLLNDDNIISLFDNSLKTPIENFNKVINPIFPICNGDYPSQRVVFDENTISIVGFGDVCVLIPYSFLPQGSDSKDASVLTNLEFKFTGDAKINSCLYDLESLQCLFYEEPVRKGDIVSFPYTLSAEHKNKTGIRIFIESANDKENKYAISNLSFWHSKSIAQLLIPKNVLTNVFNQSQSLSFDKIFLPKNIVYDPGFTITKLENFNNNCKTTITKASKEITRLEGKESIKYNSELGSFCDHFSYPNILHSQGYLVVVESKNISGLPLNICVSKYSSFKCDIYSHLSAGNAFAKDVFLLPPSLDNDIGYNINFENLGIRRSPSQNFLSSIEFIPIPYEFLENIHSISNNSMEAQLEGKVDKVTQYNPLFYIVGTNGKRTLVNLSLSYELGFRAYPVSCEGYMSCLIKGSIAPFYTKELKEHVLVNNWSNGWIVESPTSPSSKIAIIFIPQYLEYFGLVLAVGTLIVLLKRMRRN